MYHRKRYLDVLFCLICARVHVRVYAYVCVFKVFRYRFHVSDVIMTSSLQASASHWQVLLKPLWLNWSWGLRSRHVYRDPRFLRNPIWVPQVSQCRRQYSGSGKCVSWPHSFLRPTLADGPVMAVVAMNGPLLQSKCNHLSIHSCGIFTLPFAKK